MTDQAFTLDWAPEACTLPTAEQPLRQAEFDALFTASARGGERLAPQHLRVSLTGAADLAESVRDLAERETACCSFFTFAVTTPQPGQVQLDIEVSPAHVDILDALQARAIAVRDGS